MPQASTVPYQERMSQPEKVSLASKRKIGWVTGSFSFSVLWTKDPFWFQPSQRLPKLRLPETTENKKEDTEVTSYQSHGGRGHVSQGPVLQRISATFVTEKPNSSNGHCRHSQLSIRRTSSLTPNCYTRGPKQLSSQRKETASTANTPLADFAIGVFIAQALPFTDTIYLRPSLLPPHTILEPGIHTSRHCDLTHARCHVGLCRQPPQPWIQQSKSLQIHPFTPTAKVHTVVCGPHTGPDCCHWPAALCMPARVYLQDNGLYTCHSIKFCVHTRG